MLRILLFALAFTLLVDTAKAQSDPESLTPLESRARDVVTILNGDPKAEEKFAPDFLAAIPIEQVEQISEQFTEQFGPALEVVEVSDPKGSFSVITIRMERAIGELNLSIEKTGARRINGLQLLEFTPTGDTMERITADLNALDGKVSAYFGPLGGGAPTLAINPEAQMPLGSAMKLYVLGALGEEIAQGKRAWSDVIALDTKSFPSGELQDWPSGSPVTLHTLASLMISNSDNTATDQLIRLLGRERIEAYMRSTGHSAPALNTPWLTTRELFLIKGGPADQLEAFVKGDTAQRRSVLERIEDNPATLDEINTKLAAGPVAIESAEWFANAADLAGLMRTMRKTSDGQVFEIMAINPALPPSVTENWGYVGFKGGSETGVLNMTWLVADSQGRERMLTLSWSNTAKEVETQTLLLIAQRILSLPQ